MGGAREPRAKVRRKPERSEGRRLASLAARVGRGRSAMVQFAAERSVQQAYHRTTYPRAWLSLMCPPRGRRERAQARVGIDKAALADTALPSPAYRQEGAHVAAESTAITIVPPKGAKGTSASESGYRQGGFSRHRSALSCLQAGGGARCCREPGHHYCAP